MEFQATVIGMSPRDAYWKRAPRLIGKTITVTDVDSIDGPFIGCEAIVDGEKVYFYGIILTCKM